MFVTVFLYQSADAHTISSLDTAGDVGQHTSIAIGTDGFPVISYFDDSNNDLKFIHCQDGNCDLFDNIPQFITTLDGSQEVPPVSTTATGFAEFTQ